MNEEQQWFDVATLPAYLRSIGFTGATTTTVRRLITTGQLPHVRVGKKFYVGRAAVAAWLARQERRART